MLQSRTAIVFPGQGSQHRGMLESLPELDTLDRLLDAAEALSGLELRAIATLGSDEDLADTRVAQPLLYLADWAWGRTLLECGASPFVFAGHSLGEFAALTLADVFSAEAGLELVVERSKLMAASAASTAGGMAAVLGLDAVTVAGLIFSVPEVWVANDNSPTQVVISGTHEAIAEATPMLLDSGAKRVVPLSVAGAFHSPLMAAAGETFADVLRGAQMRDASIPVVQNTSACPTTDGETLREGLLGQISSPVRWTETMHALAAEDPTTIIEAGPGDVLTGLARRVENVTAYSVEDMGIESILEEVS